MMVVLASQISLLERKARREAKGNDSGSQTAQQRLMNGERVRHAQQPYLTWLELKPVIPATKTTSPTTAAKPSR